jgi:hypothetical protein
MTQGAGNWKLRRWLEVCVRGLVSYVRGLLVPLSALFSGVLLQCVATFTPGLTERFYASAFYPRVLVVLSRLSRVFSFSVGEALTVLTLSFAVVLVIIFLVRIARRREERRPLILAWLRKVTWVAAALLWSFLFTFGLNYQRPLLFDLLKYERRTAGASELEALARSIVEGVNETYSEAHADGRRPPARDEIVNAVQESYDSVIDFISLLPRGDFAPPKPVFSSEVLTRLGISGIYFPFTGEPNYNADIPDFQLPFSIAHELAHQRGVARESEANFVAYVVCIKSRDPFVRYSGYRNGLAVLSELYRVEPEKARELSRQLVPGYREDSRRAALFWAKAGGTAGALSRRVNDIYLRANRVKSGVDDYGNSTTLIIAYHLRQMSAQNGSAAR